MRELIVNADDFGLSRGTNRGILRAHDEGIVTSASLMVRAAGAEDAAREARSRPNLSLGLHVDLGEWTCQSGEWKALYERTELADAVAVAAEVDAQLGLFSELTGRPPTHLDSHQHVHRRAAVRDVVVERGKRLGIPVRHFGRVRYCGEFYGQTDDGRPLPHSITAGKLVEVLASLPEDLTELCCHPGEPDDAVVSYVDERTVELRVLCDPLVLQAVERLGLTLRSFAQVGS
jgi:predicted glycoside hydrolase/deacetylase ChbG (UPF0249 family)